MTLPDVNILVGAFREDSAHHAGCRQWVDSVINGDQPYGMSTDVLGAVTRILTNRRIFRDADSLVHVLNYVNTLVEPPNCQVVRPGVRHWEIFLRLCEQSNARGDLVPDAWFAALAIESGCEWITLDRDFRRFDGLRCRAPF